MSNSNIYKCCADRIEDEMTKRRQPIQDQLSVLGVDVLDNLGNNNYGKSSNYSQHIQLSPKHQSRQASVLMGG